MSAPRTITARDRRGHVTLAGREVLMLASNDYLGLATDPEVLAAITGAVTRLGSGLGIYPVFVTSDQHAALEAELADFLGVEAVLLTVSGGAANAAALTGLVGEGDHVFSDGDNHASTIDAARLSRAKTRPYRSRDTNHLRELLAEAPEAGRRLVITNGVFSMDGGLAPLDELTAICRDHGALLVVDDAHATGVVGPEGRGTLAAKGLPPRLPGVFVTGSLSKALGGAGGGFIGGPSAAIETLRRQARSFVFTQGMTSATTAAALTALRRHRADSGLNAALWRNIAVLEETAQTLGLDLAPSDSAVRTLRVGDEGAAMALQARLLERGLFVQAMTFPIVPRGDARLRLQPSAAHEPDALRQALHIIHEEMPR